MRKTFMAAAVFALGASLAFGGVVKTTKTEVAFKKFGTFKATMTDKIAETKKLGETTSEFKGQGVLGTIAAKTVLRSGQTGELVDLAGMTIYEIDHKRKEYTATTIEKWAETQRQAAGRGQAGPESEKTESDIRITKSEFKVEKTGETKTTNGFPTTKYLALWTVDWENVKTGEKGTDRLETAVWTTPTTDALRASLAEEMKFSQAYLKAVGLDANTLQRDILGTQWLTLLAGFDPAGGSKMKAQGTTMSKEMKKIEGYPIIIDGKYYPAPRPQAAEAEDQGRGGIGGALGKLGGKLLKKKPNPEEEKAPAVAFTTEVVSVSAAPVDPNDLQIPANYKKKG
jgi:hypothetical protein